MPWPGSQLAMSTRIVELTRRERRTPEAESKLDGNPPKVPWSGSLFGANPGTARLL